MNINCSECQNKNKKRFVYTTCSELGIFMYSTCNSMNNLSSYCGLVDSKIRAPDKDLIVQDIQDKTFFSKHQKFEMTIFPMVTISLSAVVRNHVKLLRVINSRRGFSKGTVLYGGY